MTMTSFHQSHRRTWLSSKMETCRIASITLLCLVYLMSLSPCHSTRVDKRFSYFVFPTIHKNPHPPRTHSHPHHSHTDPPTFSHHHHSHSNPPRTRSHPHPIPAKPTTTNPPSISASIDAQQFLDKHNVVRSIIGVANLTWDATVASYAQGYAKSCANTCRLEHSHGKYGENLAEGTGDFTTGNAVDMWVAEKENYNYETNTCKEGAVCGHYTQVVWRNSVRLGCARLQCTNGAWFISCNYDPPGNYVGERPY